MTQTCSKCTFRVYRKVYEIPVDHPETDTGDDFYYYIDGMHGEFEPVSSELLLETDDRAEAEKRLDTLGEDMDILYLDRQEMPEKVKIERIDLRGQLEGERNDNSLEDRLTPVTILHEPNDP